MAAGPSQTEANTGAAAICVAIPRCEGARNAQRTESTPRVAGALAPRLTRNLPQHQLDALPSSRHSPPRVQRGWYSPDADHERESEAERRARSFVATRAESAEPLVGAGRRRVRELRRVPRRLHRHARAPRNGARVRGRYSRDQVGGRL